MVRRSLVILIVLALAAGMLSGCGGQRAADAPASGPVTVSNVNLAG